MSQDHTPPPSPATGSQGDASGPQAAVPAPEVEIGGALEPGPGVPSAGGSWTETIVGRSWNTISVKADERPVVPRTVPVLLRTPGAPEPRYLIGARLSSDMSGKLFAGTDTALARPVALRVLSADRVNDPDRLGMFLRDARIAARLDHPNIAPVYDIDQTPSGDLYLTMRLPSGSTLDEALAATVAGKETVWNLRDWRTVCDIMGKISDALAFAHDRGIIHRDIKPDNILLGSYGEVLLTNWQSAIDLNQGPGTPLGLSGTPMYMSPEQARGESVDLRTDIYALGATLYHLLTLRHPLSAATDEEFWRRKRAGEVDPPPVDTVLHIPDAVLAVANRAMAADPARRHPSARAFAAELLDAVEQRHSGAYAAAQRPARWPWAALVAGLLAAALLLPSVLADLGEQQTLEYSTDFEDGSWMERLKVFRGFHPDSAFTQRDGRLVSAGRWSNVAFYDRMLSGRIRVEFEGEVLPGEPPCDLSLVWSQSDPFSPNFNFSTVSLLQVGAYDNESSLIMIAGDRVALNPCRLESGRRYQLRFEVGDDSYAIFLDGQPLCSYQAPLGLPRNGWVGIYSYYPGKAFDRLRIWRQGRSDSLPATILGDSYLRDGQPERAAAEYGQLAVAVRGGPLADEARFREGVALLRSGRREEATRAWAQVADPKVRPRITMQTIADDVTAGRHAEAIQAMQGVYQDSPELRREVVLQWVRAVGQTSRGRSPELDGYLALARRTLRPEPLVDNAFAQALFVQYRYQEVVERFPHIRSVASRALTFLGREEEVLAGYPDCTVPFLNSLTQLGRFEAVKQHPLSQGHKTWVKLFEGHYEDALAEGRNSTRPFPYTAHCLLALGRMEEYERTLTAPSPLLLLHQGRLAEALELLERQLPRSATAPDPGWEVRHQHTCLLIRAGRADEAMAQAKLREWERRRFILEAQVIEAARAGQTTVLSGLRQEHARMPTDWTADRGNWFFHAVVLPFLDWEAGDRQAFVRAVQDFDARHREHWAHQGWYALQYLTGRIDAERLRQQPVKAIVNGELPFLDGLRCELAGDRAAAAVAYRRYLALPLGQRLWNRTEGNPLVDTFAAWRQQVCQGQGR